MREYLGSQFIYYLPEGKEAYEKAARRYFDLRRQGITIRGTVDMLIAVTAMEHDLMLLHNDRGLNTVAAKTPKLKILTALP